ncbi:hypothetical protein AAVH_25307 [Aphelenchoides avenae]|nr:hypothetical protein AAVH_25307 [Aphelenchus avenae]
MSYASRLIILIYVLIVLFMLTLNLAEARPQVANVWSYGSPFPLMSVVYGSQ